MSALTGIPSTREIAPAGARRGRRPVAGAFGQGGLSASLAAQVAGDRGGDHHGGKAARRRVDAAPPPGRAPRRAWRDLAQAAVTLGTDVDLVEHVRYRLAHSGWPVGLPI
jgi:hypothetical protein